MRQIDVKDLDCNFYKEIAYNWMLITAGDKDNYNTMTASWGEIGSLWGHHDESAVATIYIRPTRYTKEYVDNNEYFSLCFFDDEYHKDLGYLGTVSGRDEDKVSKTSLHIEQDENTVYFKEAKLVLICRKLYKQELKEECFLDKQTMNDAYPLKDFHTMYIGKIEKAYIK